MYHSLKKAHLVLTADKEQSLKMFCAEDAKGKKLISKTTFAQFFQNKLVKNKLQLQSNSNYSVIYQNRRTILVD